MRLYQRWGLALHQYGVILCLHVCVCVFVCVPNAAMLACLTMSSGKLEGCESDWRDQAVIRCYQQCSDQILALSLRFGYGAATSPGSLSVPTPEMMLHGWLHVQLQSQPWPFFRGYPPTLTSFIWATKQTTRRSLCLCVLSLFATALSGKSGRGPLPNASRKLLIQ